LPAKQLRFMQGNEAVVEAALLAGVRFFAGYPITPATEILELMARRLPQVGGYFMQMEDELAGMAAAVGASIGGVKALTATSGPGFTLKQENLGYAIMVEMPCVVVNVQRGGPSTGLPTLPAQGDVMQARWGTHWDHPIVVLSPSSVNEAFDLTIQAVNISELLRTPVILLSDALVGHLREKVVMPDPENLVLINRKMTTVLPEAYVPYRADEDGVPPFAPRGTGYRFHVTSNVYDEEGHPAVTNHEVADKLMRRLHKKIDYYRDQITYINQFFLDDAEVIVIAYGCIARSAREAVHNARKEGLKAGLLQLKTLWPFPDAIVKQAGDQAKALIVPEMNMGQVIGEVARATRRGKADLFPINRVDGRMIPPWDIMAKIREVI